MQEWQTKLREEEKELELWQRMLVLKQKERELKKAREKQGAEFKSLQEEEQAEVLSTTTDAQERTQDWVQSSLQGSRKENIRSLSDQDRLEAWRMELEAMHGGKDDLQKFQNQARQLAAKHEGQKQKQAKGKNTDDLSGRYRAQGDAYKEEAGQISKQKNWEGRQFGLEYLEQLGLISERDRQAFEGPPLKQHTRTSEWEQAWEELQTHRNQGKHTDQVFGKSVSVQPQVMVPTLTTNEQGTGLVLTQNTKSNQGNMLNVM